MDFPREPGRWHEERSVYPRSESRLPRRYEGRIVGQENESLATIEPAPGAVEAAQILSDLEEGVEAEKQAGGAAGLEDDLVWPDKHGRLGEEESVDMVGLDGAKDLALDLVEHAVPVGMRDGPEAREGAATIRGAGRSVGSGRHQLGVRCEPQLQQLLRPFECCPRLTASWFFRPLRFHHRLRSSSSFLVR